MEASGDLPAPFYASARRAVFNLARSEHLAHCRRKLRDLDEVVVRYPFRTRAVLVRDARLRLLPRVADWIRERGALFGHERVEDMLLQRKKSISMKAQTRRWGSLFAVR